MHDANETVALTSIRPRKRLSLLSHIEVQGLMENTKALYQLFRQCALAVLGSDAESDDGMALLQRFADFDIRVVPESRGFKLAVYNAPATAFVDGKMIQGLQDQLFSALRDIVFCNYELAHALTEPASGAITTDAVFKILRNANVVTSNRKPNLVVCWGGHSISRSEYDFSKEVGFQLGLRGLDIATGSGIGAMKGPMKGAAVGHNKQHVKDGRYVGITEPGIIASESPNAMVNELVILPDIEKRLEAFVRLSHAIIVFPGGVGTVEEILYILSIKMQPENKEQVLPLFFACSDQHKAYFDHLDAFLRSILGDDVAQYYQIISGSSEKVAQLVKQSMQQVLRHRRRTQDAYGFNWQLYIPEVLQQPFIPSHENMLALELGSNTPIDELCVNLRAAFSGIVAGNVKAFGIEQVAKHGPYELCADTALAEKLDALLKTFIEQGRMAIVKDHYQPCFKVVAKRKRL